MSDRMLDIVLWYLNGKIGQAAQDMLLIETRYGIDPLTLDHAIQDYKKELTGYAKRNYGLGQLEKSWRE